MYQDVDSILREIERMIDIRTVENSNDPIHVYMPKGFSRMKVGIIIDYEYFYQEA